MKEWSDDHPKAKLMARKRSAIVEAARNTFLRVGYEGASMESIAAAAEVSIMTLYRHAASKDDLFEAVILSVCEASHDTQHADALMQLSLKEALVAAGNAFQGKLTGLETVSLLQTVMVETVRFPHLAKAAYHGFVEAWEVNLDRTLSDRAEFREMAAPARRTLVAIFMDDLVGTNVLRTLLGLERTSAEDRMRRSNAAAERLMAALTA